MHGHMNVKLQKQLGHGDEDISCSYREFNPYQFISRSRSLYWGTLYPKWFKVRIADAYYDHV